VVPDQQQLRPGPLDVPMDLGQSGGVGHRRLVDHHQIAGAQPPSGILAVRIARRLVGRAAVEPLLRGEPSGDVARVQAFGDEDLGGDLAGRQSEHPPPLLTGQQLVLPGACEGRAAAR
jgi:hypothetical protein